MPENEDKIKKLYGTFVSDGYDMESEEDFRKNLSDSTKRKAAYDALVKDGYEMEPFEEFARCPRWPSAAWRCAGFSSSSKGC